MDRRSFLALLGSAPLAALAPMPHFLPTRTMAFQMVMDLPPQRGYFRRSSDGEYFIYEVWRPNFPVRITDAHIEVG